MEKIISCQAHAIVAKVQPLLDDGWTMKGMVAEQVSIAMRPACETRSYDDRKEICGNIVVVLQKETKDPPIKL